MINYTETERELLIQLLQAKEDAESSVAPLVAIAEENTKYYFGLLPVPHCEDGILFTDKLVWNHVEGATSQLLPIFTSMEQRAVEFTPLSKQDVDRARALTQHLSEKVLHTNNGKQILENAIRESFIGRIAWIKTTWSTTKQASQESFSDISKAQLKELTKKHDVVESTELEEGLFKGYVIDYKDVSDLKLENIPLENMLFPAGMRDISQLPYIGQKVELMKGELIEMFGTERVNELGTGSTNSYIYDKPMITNTDDFTTSNDVNDFNNDEMVERYELIEHYILTSHLTKKALQWVQAFTVNDELLEYSVVTDNPFTPIVSVPKVNSVVGWSIADLVKDFQQQRTAIARACLTNNLNLAYPRYMALKGGYDVESLENNTAGGVVEVNQLGAVQMFSETPLPAQTYDQYDRLGIEAQKVTGVSDLNQGLDPNVLKGTNAAATVIAQMNAGSKRILGYAKSVAMGWRNVLEKSYRYMCENSNKTDVIYMSGKTYTVNEGKLEDRKLILTAVFGQDENIQAAQLLMSLADRYAANPALAKSYDVYQMEMLILDQLGIKERHLILTNPADIPVTEQELLAQKMQQETQSLALQQQGAAVNLTVAQAQSLMGNVSNDSQRVAIEAMKVSGSQEVDAEKINIEQQRLQLEAQTLGIKGLEVQQSGEIEASKLNLEQTRLQHDASVALSNMMMIPTEIAHEQSLGRPTKLGQ